MQKKKKFSDNVALQMFFILIPLLHLNLNIVISVQCKEKHDGQINVNTIIHLLLKCVKSTAKSNPNDDVLQPQSSLEEYSRCVWGAEQNLWC